jgi:microcystin-dependent protein
MKVRTIIVILALISSVVLLGQRSGTEAAVGTEFGADMPVGSIVVYAGSTAPEGWLMCDGALYDVLAYPELFGVLEFTYGSDVAKSAFRVPDLAGKVPVGAKPFTWYCDKLGKTGGEAEVSLSESEMPAHKHNVSASSHNHGISVSPHNHSVSVTSHNHSLNDPGHSHGTVDPGHSHSIEDPGHRHAIGLYNSVGGGYVDDAGGLLAGIHAHTDTTTTGITINNATTGIRINSVRTAILVQSASVPVSLKDTTVSASAQNANVSLSEASKGSGAAHENLQPYIVLNYIIKSGIPGLSPTPVR